MPDQEKAAVLSVTRKIENDTLRDLCVCACEAPEERCSSHKVVLVTLINSKCYVSMISIGIGR